MQPTIELSFLLVFNAIVFTLLAIKLLEPLAIRIHLVDVPGGRKTHQDAPPLIGGLAIFFGYTFTWALYMTEAQSLLIYTGCAATIVALGVIDDARNLPVRLRFIVQFLVSLMMCWGTGQYLGYFGDLLGIGSIDIGAWGIFITSIAVIGAINAFNMVDGIDGLAGFLALVSLGAIAILLTSSQQANQLVLAITLMVCILPYLTANLTIKPLFKKKIFMGDAGSMLLGFSIAWLLIQTTQSNTPAFRPVTALWFITVPIMDMAAIMVRRISRGLSPFTADRDHLHHILLRIGFSQRQTLLAIVTAAIVCAGFGLIGEWMKLPEWFMFITFLTLFGLYSVSLAKMTRRVENIKRKHGPTPTYGLLGKIQHPIVVQEGSAIVEERKTKVAA